MDKEKPQHKNKSRTTSKHLVKGSSERRKGQKALRGNPLFYEEVKQPLNTSLSPKALKQLAFLAEQTNMSRSEVIECLIRSNIDHLSILQGSTLNQPQELAPGRTQVEPQAQSI